MEREGPSAQDPPPTQPTVTVAVFRSRPDGTFERDGVDRSSAGLADSVATSKQENAYAVLRRVLSAANQITLDDAGPQILNLEGHKTYSLLQPRHLRGRQRRVMVYIIHVDGHVEAFLLPEVALMLPAELRNEGLFVDAVYRGVSLDAAMRVLNKLDGWFFEGERTRERQLMAERVIETIADIRPLFDRALKGLEKGDRLLPLGGHRYLDYFMTSHLGDEVVVTHGAEGRLNRSTGSSKGDPSIRKTKGQLSSWEAATTSRPNMDGGVARVLLASGTYFDLKLNYFDMDYFPCFDFTQGGAEWVFVNRGAGGRSNPGAGDGGDFYRCGGVTDAAAVAERLKIQRSIQCMSEMVAKFEEQQAKVQRQQAKLNEVGRNAVAIMQGCTGAADVVKASLEQIQRVHRSTDTRFEQAQALFGLAETQMEKAKAAAEATARLKPEAEKNGNAAEDDNCEKAEVAAEAEGPSKAENGERDKGPRGEKHDNAVGDANGNEAEAEEERVSVGERSSSDGPRDVLVLP
jgi:hypothetical protein